MDSLKVPLVLGLSAYSPRTINDSIAVTRLGEAAPAV